jgi:hypothetical protein
VTQIDDTEDEHIVANIIKLFFRELPVPLIPYTHYPRFMEIGVKVAEQEIPNPLQLLHPYLVNLPRPHLKLLLYLLKFLSEMTRYSETTKMDSSNLAIVFASNLIKPKSESVEATLKFNHVNNLIKLMIDRVDDLVKLVPTEEEQQSGDWLQDLLRHTKQTPVFFEELSP